MNLCLRELGSAPGDGVRACLFRPLLSSLSSLNVGTSIFDWKLFRVGGVICWGVVGAGVEVDASIVLRD